MLSKEYEVYVDSNIKLARSMCIKSQQTIEAVNQYLQFVGISLADVDPNNFKYYVNLRGDYWSAANYIPDYAHITLADDVIMQVKNLDNYNVLMDLTVANLLANPVTHGELKTFGRFYKDLVAIYPDQEQLIRRIIDPIPTAINGIDIVDLPDGTILFYDKRLVAKNEITLMSSLQEWIYNYFARWQIIAYANSDVLYPAASDGIFWLAVVQTLIDLRLERIKTSEVSDFHLWSYLGSFFRLDRFKKELTNEQAIFLYQNIDYIVKNAGTKETLLFIYNNMIKNYGMALNTFEIRQDSSQLATELKNSVVVNKFPIDAENLVEDIGARISVADLIEKIKGQAIMNRDYQDEVTEKTINAVLKTSSSNIATGIIECEKEHVPYKGLISHIDESFNVWFWLAGNNKFNHQFLLTAEGKDDTYITARQAALLLLWCQDRLANFDKHVYDGVPFNDVIPPAIYIPNIINGANIPPYSAMDDLIGEGFYNSIVGSMPISSELHTDYFDINSLNVISIEEFMAVVSKSEQWKMRARLGLGQFQGSEERANAELAIQEFLQTSVVDMRDVGITTWTQFMNQLDFEFDDDIALTGKEGIIAIMDLIIDHFIGNVKVQEGITSPHYEMMQILRLLSSYLVMFVAGDSSAVSRPLNWIGLSGNVTSISVGYNYPVDLHHPDVEFSFEVI